MSSVFFSLIFVSSAKRKRKRAFDEEWGSMNTEGNIWWRGSAYAEWIDIMGKHWVGWICELFLLCLEHFSDAVSSSHR